MFIPMEANTNNGLMEIDFLDSMRELHKILKETITHGSFQEDDFSKLRGIFQKSHCSGAIPKWLLSLPDLKSIRKLAQGKSDHYSEREEWLQKELQPLYDAIQNDNNDILYAQSFILKELDSQVIKMNWEKMLSRLEKDPEGAITMARTMLESELKLIAEKIGISYSKNEDTPNLYRNVSNALKISPNHHQEELFKKLLGNCSGIVTSVSEIRNSYSDAHGHTDSQYKVDVRLARFVVHVSASICLLLCETFVKYQNDSKYTPFGS